MIFAARRATTARPRRMRPPPCSEALGEGWKQRGIYCSRASGRWGDPGIGVGWGLGGSGRSSKWCSGQGGPRGVADGSAVLRASVAYASRRACVWTVWSISMELEENAMDGDTAVRGDR